jgi:hypothetical protein
MICRGTPFLVCFAITLVVVNAYCVVNCFVSPCEFPSSAHEGIPPCHHKNPQPTSPNDTRSCSHHFVATTDGIAVGHVSNDEIQIAAVDFAALPVIPLWTTVSLVVEFESPPSPDLIRSAILRI